MPFYNEHYGNPGEDREDDYSSLPQGYPPQPPSPEEVAATKRRRRKVIAFLTVPALIAVVAAAAYGLGIADILGWVFIGIISGYLLLVNS